MNRSQDKMGTQKMVPLIFSMAFPAMLSMFINALYNIVDSIFVAKYSMDALTAVSLVFPLQTLVVAIGVGTGIGVNSLIARCLGAQSHADADNAAEHGLALSVVSGIVFIIIGFFLSKPFLSMFMDNQNVLNLAIEYSQLAVGLSIFVIISMMTEKIQQATGNMIIPMIQVLLGAIINIILDPLLIFGIGPFPEMGVRGAAIATIIGQIFGMSLGVFAMLYHQKVLNIKMREFHWKKRTVIEIYRVGLPGIVMQSVAAVMTALMNKILINFSEVAVSVLGIYFKLQTFIFMPVFGINQGSMPVMGYNYGARNRKRLMSAYRVALCGAALIMIVGVILFQTFPEPMIMLFADKSNPEATNALLSTGLPALRTISWSFLGAAFGIVNMAIFQATGRGVSSLIVSLCRQLGILIPLAWLLGKFYGLSAVWWSFPISEYASFFISAILFYNAYRTEFVHLDTPKEA